MPLYKIKLSNLSTKLMFIWYLIGCGVTAENPSPKIPAQKVYFNSIQFIDYLL
jgi:hypothetical protein